MAARTPPAVFQSPTLLVRTGTGPADQQELRFHSSFRIGRAEDCQFRVQNEFVSRYQAEVLLENCQWRVRDLGSSNGIYIGGERVQEAPVAQSLTIRLGIAGPFVSL